MNPFVLEADELRIVPFESRHFTDRYISWLNDPEVVRYSEQRHIKHTRDTCQRYIESFHNTSNQLLAIEVRGELDHIGNISISIDVPNALADVAILVGEKKAWGKGYGLQAWSLVLNELLADEMIRKVTAGTMAENKPMLALMEKSGMQIEAVRPRHFLLEGKEADLVFAAKYPEL